ncbi:zinc-binding dehydrogenase [Sphingomonas abietis]|uniref:Zinc-binding dehydrogenase n=2 Tax=Sphingomonas abietis TaxID=3012344 RepID=A0ABY7NV99_9SPHN|nr:zinc-binding dehydrogenase [Sphingomonas abietis]WBO23834.1 zinc-binding dehydrogenase [Sphingomonas abietis]
MALATGAREVWGASAVGRVVALGDGVSSAYAGRQVAIYRSLHPTPEMIGLWCERAHVHHLSCLILPDGVQSHDYCGSLVNAITAYAFLEQALAERHKAIVVTAGGSATGNALAVLACDRNVPVIHLVRSAAKRDRLRRSGMEHVLDTTDRDFDHAFHGLVQDLDATAIFDGVGGDLASRLVPNLAVNSTLSFYGFLAGSAPFTIQTLQVIAKNLTIRRFSNFESATVKDPDNLAAALLTLQNSIAGVSFRTAIGREFAIEDIHAAMAFKDASGRRAVLRLRA